MKGTVKLVKKLEVSELAGEKVMIDFETGKYFMLKGTANDIWDMIQKEVTVDDIVDKLQKEYEVDKKECSEAVDEFLKTLMDYRFISFSD